MKHGIQVFAPGAKLASGAASASVALPVTVSGTPAKYVRVAATVAASVRLGGADIAATAADTLVQPGDAVILGVSGNTHLAAIQQSAAGVVQISPMEDN